MSILAYVQGHYYHFLLTAHLLALILSMGFAHGCDHQFIRAQKTGDARLIRSTLDTLVRVGKFVMLPSFLVQLVSGALLVELMGMNYNVPWLNTSMLLYVVLIIGGVAGMQLRLAMQKVVPDANAGRESSAPPAEFENLFRLYEVVWYFTNLPFYAILALMIFKPY